MEPPKVPVKRSQTPPGRPPAKGAAPAADASPLDRPPPLRSPKQGSTAASPRKAPARGPPAPPAPPLALDVLSPLPRESESPGSNRMRRTSSMSVAISNMINPEEIERSALLKAVKRSGVDKLKQTLAVGTVEENYAAERVWPETWNPHCRAPILGHDDAFNSCCVFARESRVLSCGKDGTLRMADLSTGMRVGRPLVGHEGEVHDCCVLPDQRRALSCGADGTLKIWKLLTAEEDVRTWDDCHTEAVNAICIFVVGDGTNGEPQELALSASEDGTLKVWDLQSGSRLATLKATDEKGKPEKGSGVKSCCVYQTSTGEWEALSGGADNHVRRWAVMPGGGRFGKEIKHEDSGSASWPDDGTGSPWMAKHDTLKARTGHTGLVLCCCASKDGKHALTCSGDRTANFWDLTTGTVVRTLQHVSSVFSCCFLPEEKLALTASSFAPRLWDVYSGECLRVFAGHSGEVHHCVSPLFAFFSAPQLLLRITESRACCLLFVLPDYHEQWEGTDLRHRWQCPSMGPVGT